MLTSLFGNSVIEKILFFLLKNDTAYASQVSKIFEIPLYSFQKAFDRLEKGRIVVSHRVGKTRIYQFNPQYPMLHELRTFLTKTYEFLPDEVKLKDYEAAVRKRPRRRGKPL